MTDALSSKERVDSSQVQRYIAALKAPAKAFQYCHPNTLSELTAALEELLSLRTTLRGIQSCSTCEACRRAATLTLGGAQPPEAAP